MSVTDSGGADLPAPDAGAAPNRLTGYARAADDSAAPLQERLRLLRDSGCTRVCTEEAAGPDAGQPRLRECLDSLGPGDILVATSLDQLGRTQRALAGVVAEVRRRGAGLRSLREDLDTTAPGGEAIFRVFAGLADLGRAAISAGTSDGLAAARGRGTRLGRPPALTAQQLGEVRELLTRPQSTVSGVARQLGVSRSTLYKYLPDVMGARPPVCPGTAGAAPGQAVAAGPVAHLAPYQAKPGRRVLVIDRLDDLRGPTAGSVELPLRLFWSLPGHRFDLGDPDMRRWYYQTVLREASRAADLTGYLDAGTLARLWPDLFLPRGVRRAWEEQHPSLRAGVRI
jgi:DNA invertase Pin-like site-specific DNA recombinase